MAVLRDQTTFDLAWNAILEFREFLDLQSGGAEGWTRENPRIVGFRWDSRARHWEFCSDICKDELGGQHRSLMDANLVVVGVEVSSSKEGLSEIDQSKSILRDFAAKGGCVVNPDYMDSGEPFWLLEVDKKRPEMVSLLTPLRLYLPIVLGGFQAKRQEACFAIGHLAQTLDGRIASHIGSSRWISNEANLIHAHRLRALSDAVAVGWRTAVADNCKLTVRFVEGRNPTRVILDPRGRLEQEIDHLELFSDQGPTVILVSNIKVQKRLERVLPFNADVFVVDFKAEALMKFLGSMGIYNLLVEGGGRTISSLIAGLPILHLHFSPRILGSGIPSFTLDKVDTIGDSISLDMEAFNLGNEVLLECTHMK